MKHPEGMHVSLVEEGMLDGSGVLKSAEGCTAAYGMSDLSVQLFLAAAAAGDGGIAQNKLPKELRENLEEALLPLELQNLVEWERDNRGRKAYLVLSWKGKEALEAARSKPTSTGTWATRRRAAVSPATPTALPEPAIPARRRTGFDTAEGCHSVDSLVPVGDSLPADFSASLFS